VAVASSGICTGVVPETVCVLLPVASKSVYALYPVILSFDTTILMVAAGVSVVTLMVDRDEPSL